MRWYRGAASSVAAACSVSVSFLPNSSSGFLDQPPSRLCESETQREYGKNGYAGYAKDPAYREAVWNALFTTKGNTTHENGKMKQAQGSNRIPETASEERLRQTQAEAKRTGPEGLAISCEELLEAARKGMGLKRALKLVHITGQHDMLATCTDAAGRTPVMLSAMQGNVDNVDLCLQSHPAPREAVLQGDSHGVTPLEVASWKGHYMVVDYLLQEGADANAHDQFGVAPLHKAVGHGQRRVALRLLQDGSCNVNLRCRVPTVPADYEAITTLQTPLHIACRRHAHGLHVQGDRSMAALLLSWGANPRLADIWGNTPLHYAAQAGDIDMVRLLIKNGADKRLRNAKGEAPGDMMPDWIFYESWGPALEDLLLTPPSASPAAAAAAAACAPECNGCSSEGDARTNQRFHSGSSSVAG